MLQSRNPLGIGLQDLTMATPPYWSGPQGVGAPQLPQTPMMPPPQAAQATGQPQRSKGQMIAGILSDGIKGYLGQQGTFGQALASEAQQQRQAQQEEVQWTRRREADRADKQWEWQNKPRDTTPYRFEDNAGNRHEIGPDGQIKQIFTDPTPKINYQRVNNPDGTFTMVPIPMGGVPAAGGAPTAPVGKLTPMGGGAGNGVGGFPR